MLFFCIRLTLLHPHVCSSTNTDDLLDQLCIITKVIDKCIVQTSIVEKLTSFGTVRNVGSLNHLISHSCMQQFSPISQSSIASQDLPVWFDNGLTMSRLHFQYRHQMFRLAPSGAQCPDITSVTTVFHVTIVASCWPGWTTVMEFSPAFSSVGCSPSFEHTADVSLRYDSFTGCMS